MATRNMEQIAAAAVEHIPEQYDIDSEELKRLMRAIKDRGFDGAFDALCMAFNFGFAMGNRATKAGKVTRRL